MPCQSLWSECSWHKKWSCFQNITTIAEWNRKRNNRVKVCESGTFFWCFCLLGFVGDSLTNFVGTISTYLYQPIPISSLAIHKQSALGFRTVPSACFGRVFGLLCGGLSDPKGTLKMGMFLFAPVSCRIKHDQNQQMEHARYSDIPSTGLFRTKTIPGQMRRWFFSASLKGADAQKSVLSIWSVTYVTLW